MEERGINVEGNVGMSCQNPNQRLHVPCNTTDADHRHAFGIPQHVQDDIKLEINENTKVGMQFNPNQEFFIFQDGHIGIGTPYVSPQLDIYKK
jgi:glutamine synthetase